MENRIDFLNKIISKMTNEDFDIIYGLNNILIDTTDIKLDKFSIKNNDINNENKINYMLLLLKIKIYINNLIEKKLSLLQNNGSNPINETINEPINEGCIGLIPNKNGKPDICGRITKNKSKYCGYHKSQDQIKKK